MYNKLATTWSCESNPKPHWWIRGEQLRTKGFSQKPWQWTSVLRWIYHFLEASVSVYVFDLSQFWLLGFIVPLQRIQMTYCGYQSIGYISHNIRVENNQNTWNTLYTHTNIYTENGFTFNIDHLTAKKSRPFPN